MRFSTAVFVASLAAVASAHFQLQYPTPRGVFVEDDEPTYCDGYVSAVSNRTVYPLTAGKISINSEHPSWTLGAILATVQNPENFTVFEDSSGNFQMAVPFFETTGEGLFCIDLDLAATGISGVKDGANVTLQLVFDGGDDKLYQCADLTLSANATTPSDLTCKNATDSVSTPVSSTVSSTATSTGATSTTTSSSAMRNAAAGVSGLAALVGAVAAFF